MSDGIRRVSAERGGGWEYFNKSSNYTLPLPRNYHDWDHNTRMAFIDQCREEWNMHRMAEERASPPVRPVPPEPRYEHMTTRVFVDDEEVVRPHLRQSISLPPGESKMMYEVCEGESPERVRFKTRKMQMKAKLQMPDKLHDFIYYGINHNDAFHEDPGFNYGPNPTPFAYANRIEKLIELECVTDLRLIGVKFTAHMSSKLHDLNSLNGVEFNHRDRVFIHMEIGLDDGRTIDLTFVLKSYQCEIKDINNLANIRENTKRIRMEKYIHRCKKKVLPHYDPKKSYTKLTEEEMPQCLMKDNVFR